MEFQYAADEWYVCEIDRKQLKALSRRSDAKGLTYLGVYLALVVGSGALAYLTWGTYWAIPAFLLYAAIYMLADFIQHECIHGTPFHSRWLNETVYWATCFTSVREPVFNRWSHAIHHTNTKFVGTDPEIQVPRPTNLPRLAGEFVSLWHISVHLSAIVKATFGIMSKEVKQVVPENEFPTVVRNARWILAGYAAVLAGAIAAESWLPILFIFFPRIFGTWIVMLYGITEHAALADNVRDHRLNTRTVLMNPVLTFLVWNANYHVEHTYSRWSRSTPCQRCQRGWPTSCPSRAGVSGPRGRRWSRCSCASRRSPPSSSNHGCRSGAPPRHSLRPGFKVTSRAASGERRADSASRNLNGTAGYPSKWFGGGERKSLARSDAALLGGRRMLEIRAGVQSVQCIQDSI